MSNYKHGGYDKKYIITKKSGKPINPNADYFVLRVDKDPHALVALESYANSVKVDNMELYNDLIQKINEYKRLNK